MKKSTFTKLQGENNREQAINKLFKTFYFHKDD